LSGFSGAARKLTVPAPNVDKFGDNARKGACLLATCQMAKIVIRRMAEMEGS
jgi:hypothetical protein